MPKVLAYLMIAALCATGTTAGQTAQTQTARQALLEMFFSKTPGTMVKHLPAATKAALEKSGAMAQMQQYSALINQSQTQGQKLQTFETGPILLTTEDAKTSQKTEVIVENDSPRGDTDDIELWFRIYKNGEAQHMAFMPHLTFTMKREGQLWTLNEVSVTIHLPLDDPELLKAVSEKVKPQAVASNSNGVSVTTASATPTAFVAQPQVTVQAGGTDAQVIAAMRTILTAEVTYATTYPNVGFTCMLSDLDGFGGGEPNEHQAMLINSGLASGKKYSFVFSLSGCGRTPATTFHLTAVPNANIFGRKAFCADQSAVIKSSPDGNAATCLASGTPVQ